MASDMKISHTSAGSNGFGLSCSIKVMLVYLAFRYCAGNRRRSGWEAEAIAYLANGLWWKTGKPGTLTYFQPFPFAVGEEEIALGKTTGFPQQRVEHSSRITPATLFVSISIASATPDRDMDEEAFP